MREGLEFTEGEWREDGRKTGRGQRNDAGSNGLKMERGRRKAGGWMEGDGGRKD